jgi:hypothetical protein
LVKPVVSLGYGDRVGALRVERGAFGGFAAVGDVGVGWGFSQLLRAGVGGYDFVEVLG